MEAELLFRLLFALILIVTVSISAYYRKRAREVGGTIARREEGAVALGLRAALTLPVLAVFLLYIFLPQVVAWSTFSLPVWVRWTGIGIGVVGIALTRWVFVSIGKNVSETVLTKTGHQLVTGGPYRWVRHPLYSVGLLQIAALGSIASNWFILGTAFVTAVIFRFVVIPKEEENLIKAFGREYEDYRKRTGALFLRFW